ncbi:MAG: DUF4838 domain-containing protein [Verrucomicrobia bacterium]|nr:DUF4838 domain-containing protein [Verrucomicrobiota bacterium]
MRTRNLRLYFGLIGMWMLSALPLAGGEENPKKTSAVSLVLARDGRAQACIVLGAGAVPAEQTAAAELAAYLGKATGGKFDVVNEAEAPMQEGGRVYIGTTEAAKRQGIKTEALGPEEWVMRVTDDGLILTGGRPRGTLYAVYRFLEDVVGVHWWSPLEETVPQRPTLVVSNLSRRGEPTFRYREIHALGAVRDGGRFATRNRLNYQDTEPISREFGGGAHWGLPYHVHTFDNGYVPPKEYFAKHPEWFSLIEGERSEKQLCLTNQELRKHVVHKLRGYIKDSRAKAEAAGITPPPVFDISQNDWEKGACQCANCQAIAETEESAAGPLLDFLNYIVDAIKDDHPDVYIETLAYHYTQKPPKNIKAREKIIVRLCDTLSNHTAPVTHPDNATLRESILGWARVVKHMYIWDYAVTFADGPGMGELPTPTVHTYPVDLRFYAQQKVEGVFAQYAHPVLDDMRDFKLWMMIKLLECPDRDYAELVCTFTDGFYGPAGKFVRKYLGVLEAASEAKRSYLLYSPQPSTSRYLDMKFIRKAHDVFDQAESAVAHDAVLLRRVRHARLVLDLTTIRLFRRLAQEWVQSGKALKDMPLDRDRIFKRCFETWNTEIDRRFPRDYYNYWEKEHSNRMAIAAELAQSTSLPLHVGLPANFEDMPPASVHDFMADLPPRCARQVVKLVADTEAESGIANRLEFSTRPATGVQSSDEYKFVEKYKLPMRWGIYDCLAKEFVVDSEIREEDVPGPGYHWYKIRGSRPIGPAYYVHFFWYWLIQQDIGSVHNAEEPDQKFDVWARIKFEGPSFPYGKLGERDAICVERVVVTSESR